MVSKESVYSALNQLIALVGGGSVARHSSGLSGDPLKRTQYCIDAAASELQEVVKQPLNSGTPAKRKQIERKLDGLSNLAVLSQLTNEIIWDD